MTTSLSINNRTHHVEVPSEMPLLWVLRDELGLVGTKFGCGAGLCGACTVHVDGKPRRSCQLTVGQIGSAKVTTIEAIGSTKVGAALQQAWVAVDTPQCGYCQAGQIMSAAALLATNPHPDREQIAAAMFGNLCRCASYHRIVEAIEQAAGEPGHAG